MTDATSAPARRLAPLGRSLSVQVELVPGTLWWGATWACLCGVVAAAPWPVSGETLARAAVAWLVAVPLAGGVWVPLLEAAGARRMPASARPAWTAAGLRPGSRAWVSRSVAQLADLPPAWIDRLFCGVSALVLGILLGHGVGALLLLAFGLLALVRLGGTKVPASHDWIRSTVEIALPAAVGFAALGGVEQVPALVAATAGPASVASVWLGNNWPMLALGLAFTVMHHAATAVHRPEDVARRVDELRASYIGAAGALAVSGHTLAAGAVALLFVVQWPFQAGFAAGHVGWHLRATQWLAMVTMLVAAAAGGMG